MIVIEEERDLLKVGVYAEFTLADYQEFERAVGHELKSAKRRKLNLLLDFSQMTGFTLDVAWEDIKFTKAHVHQFRRIAVVTADQWTSWLSWLSFAFTDADVNVFRDIGAAKTWLAAK